MLNTPTMNLDYIRTFVIVGQSKGIYEAASKLNLDYTNVSRHIKALEKLYGTKLVRKISKNYIELTEDGKELFDGYEKAYNLLFLAEKNFIQNKNLNSGKISIGTSTDIELNFLNDKIIRFKEKYANTAFKITNSPIKELYEKLTHYNIDFIIGDQLNLKRSDGIKSKVLYNEEYCLVYDEKKYTINNLSDINELPLILPVSTKSERKLFENLLQENNVKRNLSIETSNYCASLDLACKGVGIALVPASMTKNNILLKYELPFKKPIVISYVEENLSPSSYEFLKEFDN